MNRLDTRPMATNISKSVSTEATTPWQLLVPRPTKCTPASAAALPTVYTAVDVAFAELAKLKKGEKATRFFFGLEIYIGRMTVCMMMLPFSFRAFIFTQT